MSNWTHVAGIVRVDHLILDPEDGLDFDAIFGKECLWESDASVWKDADENPESYLPMGSEGSLRKVVWKNPDTSCLAAYSVMIFGDLRDHHDPAAIVEWFKDICENKFSVRNASLEVVNEMNGVETYSFNLEQGEVEK